MINYPDKMTVVEVAPRDGLQSLPKWVETADKVRMVDRLSAVGFPVIEVTGFVSPRAIPNLRDAEDVFERIARRRGTVYRALVPNARGAQRAAAAKVDEMLGLITMSRTYLKMNQNMTLDEAVEEAIAAFHIADAAGISFVQAIGMALWCAYEGAIAESEVLALVRKFHEAGIRRFYVAGSVGMEDPRHVGRLIGRILAAHPDVQIGFHVHNLSGWGQANVLAALDAGAHWIEGSICGIGGGVTMPSALGSVGNLPTEDIVAMLDTIGVRTGLEPEAVVQAARDVAALLGIKPRSHAGNGATRAEVLHPAP